MFQLFIQLFVFLVAYLCQAIDAVDNGINEYDTDQPPKYVNNTHLSSRVGRLNLDWMDPDQSSDKENEAFQQAMMLAGGEFLDVSFPIFLCWQRTVCFIFLDTSIHAS